MFVYSLRIQTNPATRQIWAISRKDFMEIVNKHDNKRKKMTKVYKHKLFQEPTNSQILDKLQINNKCDQEKRRKIASKFQPTLPHEFEQ